MWLFLRESYYSPRVEGRQKNRAPDLADLILREKDRGRRRKNMRSHWCDFLPSPLYIEVDMEKESNYVQRSGEKKEMSFRFLELLGIWGNPSPFRDVLINERWDAASAALQTHYWRRRRRRVAFMMSAIPPISTVTTAKAGSKSHFDSSERSKKMGAKILAWIFSKPGKTKFRPQIEPDIASINCFFNCFFFNRVYTISANK